MTDPVARSATTEVLAGLVERVTFHNAENGFCVLRVKARGQRELITVVGHAATIAAGEFVQLSGSWVNDRTHGLQFRAGFLKASPPTTLEGIERYLGSGMIRGIGPIYARRLVRTFGATVFERIEQQPERLREVTGIGPKRAARIVAGWAEQKVKIPPAVQSMLERGLLEVRSTARGPRAFFTEAGLAALRQLVLDRRAMDPERFAHLRVELGLEA